MKIANNGMAVESGGVQHQGEFRIKNSAKAFSILSSGLYSNKHEAILRELGCNAYDSHVAAGKADVPFTVHLPTKMNPTLSIRDYGTGLDNDGVINIYTTYFESTKQDSNEFVGCMGLGSKSPFSYTDTFAITAIKDGVKRQYTAFINESGIPAIARLHEEPTPEANGVEVSFAVSDSSDMYRFKNEAARVFSWFRTKPTITGQDVTINPIKFSEKDIVPGVHVIDRNGYHSRDRSVALMGNVSYPIKLAESRDDDEYDDRKKAKQSDTDARHAQIRKMLDNANLVLEFKIGELDVAASREELSYIPHTLNSIYAKGEEVLQHLNKYVEEQVAVAKTKWERLQILSRLYKSNNVLFATPVVDYVAKNPALLPNGASANTYGIYHRLFITDLNKIWDQLGLNVSYYTMSERYNSTNGIGALNRRVDSSYYGAGTTVTSPSYQIDDETTFVFLDDKGGVLPRVKAAFKTKKITKAVMVFRIRDKDVPNRMDIYKQVIELLGTPERVMYTSSLPRVTAAKVKRAFAPYRFVQGAKRSHYQEANHKFVVEYDDKKIPYTLEKEKIYLYVPLEGHQVLMANGGHVDADNLRTALVTCNVCPFLGINVDHIYGLNKSTQAVLRKNPNPAWVDFFDYLLQKFGVVDWSKVKETVRKRYIISDICGGDYNLSQPKKAALKPFMNRNSAFGKLATLYMENKGKLADDNEIKYEKVIEFVSRFAVDSAQSVEIQKLREEIDIHNVDKSLAMLMTEIKATYPLLKKLDLNSGYSTSDWPDALDYIALVDNANKAC